MDERAEAMEAVASSIRDRVEVFEKGERERAPRSRLRTLVSQSGYRRVTPGVRARLAEVLHEVKVAASPALDAPGVDGDSWITFSSADRAGPALRFPNERALQQFLVHNWRRIDGTRHLEIIKADSAKGDDARCDILAFDQRSGEYVVIELKDDVSDERLPHQLNRYMKLVFEARAEPHGHGVRGVVITREPNAEMAEYLSKHSDFEVEWWTFQLSMDVSR